ncbi:hypothetical protein Dimus_005925 [Dionaea muscipula]
MVFPPPSIFSDLASNIPSTSHVPSEPTSQARRTETFDLEMALEGVLQERIDDGAQWNVKQSIDPSLLIDASLATVPAVVPSPSPQDSLESSNPSNPGPNRSYSSGSEDNSDASKSEEDSDDSSLDSSPYNQHL